MMDSTESNTPEFDKQLKIAQSYSKRPLQAGDAYYLCSPGWFRNFKSYINAIHVNSTFLRPEHVPFSHPKPGPIEIQSLLTEKGKLKPSLVADYDFALIYLD